MSFKTFKKRYLVELLILGVLAAFAPSCGGRVETKPGDKTGENKKKDPKDDENKQKDPNGGTVAQPGQTPKKVLDPNGDKDGDGVKNSDDNCPEVKNPQQEDWDKDKVGDACDICPRYANPRDKTTGEQENWCNSSKPNFQPKPLSPSKDSDHDGKKDNDDNCPFKANPGQVDKDGDGVGDACDNCPDAANAADENGVQPNVCDPTAPEYQGDKNPLRKDSDKDGIPDTKDNCPFKANPDQEDGDHDKVGDECDNCPSVFNPDQINSPTTFPNDKSRGDACKENIPGEACNVDGDCAASGAICSSLKVCACGDEKAKVNLVPPKIYLLLDNSGSMKNKNRIPTATNALDQLADSTATFVDYGVMFFSETVEKKLSPGKHSISALKNSWSSYDATSDTRTGLALDTVRADNSFVNSTEKKAVILVTDGEPYNNSLADCQSTWDSTHRTRFRFDNNVFKFCSYSDATEYQDSVSQKSANKAIKAAKDLYAAGVVTYVLGVNYNPTENVLQDLAQAGSGNKENFYNANNTNLLAKKLKSIAIENVSCDLKVKASSKSPVVYVFFKGKKLERLGDQPDYTYNVSTTTVTLSAAICEKMKEKLELDGDPAIQAVVACEPKCQADKKKDGTPWQSGDPEWKSEKGIAACFDHRDNNCDGRFDEGCDCKPEVCGDLLDNDCDGVVDNGCPGSKKVGEDCEYSAECEKGTCKGNPKKCVDECRTGGEACSSDDQCCAPGVCGLSGLCITG